MPDSIKFYRLKAITMPSLEITTMIGCPLMCTFCPQTALKAAYGKERADKYLSLTNFRHIIDKLPKNVRIDFSGMAEPWANPECTEMLRYTLRAGFDVTIYSTLHDITESDADVVIDLLRKHRAQVLMLCLHLPDANGNMRGWKPSREWENVFTKFRRFGAEMDISNFEMMTMDGSGRVHEALENLHIELADWRGHTRADSLDQSDVKGQTFYEKTPQHTAAVNCGWTRVYDRNVLLPNGDVVLCCMDYNLKHILGNLLTREYYDLFEGETLNRLRQVNMTPAFSKCSICKSCSVAVTYDHIAARSLWSSERSDRAGLLSFKRRMVDQVANQRLADFLLLTAKTLRPLAKGMPTISPLIDRIYKEGSDMWWREHARCANRQQPERADR